MASHIYLAYENKIHKEQSIIFLAKGTLEYDILFKNLHMKYDLQFGITL